jgi:FAD:protein FMN transferase
MMNIIYPILISLTILSCNSNSIKPYTKTSFAMGTICTITLYEKKADFNIEKAFKIIYDIENKMSRVIINSEISEVNANAGIKPTRVSESTFFVIKEGLKYGKLSNNKFDITIGPLVNLWGIGTENQAVPNPDSINDVLPSVESENVKLNDKDMSVLLENKGMSIDLGGIAKGYATDLLKDFLIKEGFTKGIINLGGNVLTFGSKDEGIPWKIGVQNPVDSRGHYIGTINLSENAVVTSGIYERYFEADGKKYHHILDPYSGYPIENKLLSITIITNSGIVADAYSTIIFSEGLSKGMEILESINGMDGIFVTKDKEVYISSGIKDSFILLSPDFNRIF